MRLYLIETPERLAFIDKILSKIIDIPDRRMIAANALLDVDPTNVKKYVPWLAKLVTNGIISIARAVGQKPTTQIRLPEDNQRIQDLLATFERAKPRLEQQYRDILKFTDVYKLEDYLSKIINSGKSESVGSSVVKQVPGAEIIYNQTPYTLYRVNNIKGSMIKLDKAGQQNFTDPETEERISAVGILGMGPPETKWCTRSAFGRGRYAQHYLKSNDIYVLYKDGVPFMQKCGGQVMDVNDRHMQPPPAIDAVIQKDINTQLELKRQKLAAANKIRLANFEKQIVPEGKSLVLVSSEASGLINSITCGKIVDAGTFYYIGINEIDNGKTRPTRGRRPANLRKVLEDSGMAEIKRYLRYPNGKTKRSYDVQGRVIETTAEKDSSTYFTTNWKYYPILTVKKENVLKTKHA